MSTNTEISVLETNIDTELEIVKVEIQPLIKAHRERVKKYITYGEGLLNQLKENGGEMTEDLYKTFISYDQAGTTLEKSLKENRAIVTTSMTLVSKQFTSVEALVDKAKENTIRFEVAKICNAYVTAIALAEKNRLAAIARQQAKNEEAIKIKSEIEKLFNAYFNQYLTKKKLDLNGIFNQITLATFDEKSAWFTTLAFGYSMEHFSAFRCNVPAAYHSPDEWSSIFTTTLNPLFDEVSAIYQNAMRELRSFLVDRLQSKKNELQTALEFKQEQEKLRLEDERLEDERKQASAARQKEIEAEQTESNRKSESARQVHLTNARLKEERETEEKQRIEAEQKALEQKQNEAIETKAATENVLNLFEKEVETASTPEAPKIKEGWEIIVTHHGAYMEIFLNWFNKVGKDMTIEALDNKLDFARKFCEKEVTKDESKMMKSNLFKYQPTYKADTRKTKADKA